MGYSTFEYPDQFPLSDPQSFFYRLHAVGLGGLVLRKPQVSVVSSFFSLGGIHSLGGRNPQRPIMPLPRSFLGPRDPGGLVRSSFYWKCCDRKP